MPSLRKNKGRQKIEMKKMTNDSNLQVTFSKRRNGLFKKASELCTLCNAEVALIVFSPGGKIFSFGHPDVETLIHRYFTGAPPHASTTMQILEAQRNTNVRELNAQLTNLANELEGEKKHAEELNKLQKASQAQCWWAGLIDDMNDQQLNQFKFTLEQLKKTVAHESDRMLFQSAINPTPAPQSFPAGSSSTPSSQMLQTPIFHNPITFVQNNDHGFDLNVVNPYDFNNLGGYGPGSGAGFY